MPTSTAESHSTGTQMKDMSDYLEASPDVDTWAWVTRPYSAHLKNIGATRDTKFKLYGVTPPFKDAVFEDYWQVRPGNR